MNYGMSSSAFLNNHQLHLPLLTIGSLLLLQPKPKSTDLTTDARFALAILLRRSNESFRYYAIVLEVVTVSSRARGRFLGLTAQGLLVGHRDNF